MLKVKSMQLTTYVVAIGLLLACGGTPPTVTEPSAPAAVEIETPDGGVDEAEQVETAPSSSELPEAITLEHDAVMAEFIRGASSAALAELYGLSYAELWRGPDPARDLRSTSEEMRIRARERLGPNPVPTVWVVSWRNQSLTGEPAVRVNVFGVVFPDGRVRWAARSEVRALERGESIPLSAGFATIVPDLHNGFDGFMTALAEPGCRIPELTEADFSALPEGISRDLRGSIRPGTETCERVSAAGDRVWAPALLGITTGLRSSVDGRLWVMAVTVSISGREPFLSRINMSVHSSELGPVRAQPR